MEPSEVLNLQFSMYSVLKSPLEIITALLSLICVSLLLIRLFLLQVNFRKQHPVQANEPNKKRRDEWITQLSGIFFGR